MTIKEEFEKAYSAQFHPPFTYPWQFKKALWAAQWITNKCTKLSKPEIRQLAKELE